MINLIIALLVLVLVALLLIGALLFYRQRRRAQTQHHGLPMYNDSRASTSSSHRRIMVRPSESIYVYQEKKDLLETTESPPDSPVPEIRITFPEEVDEAGKRTSGRVMVVRVGETSVGLEPVKEKDDLPAYQKDENDRFQSLDLDRIGGLTEKEHMKQWS